MMTSRKILAAAIASLAFATVTHGQDRAPVIRPRPQRPPDIPPAVVVLRVDTSAGDSTRVIIQRDLDYGDRVQPLYLDEVTLADIWQPGGRRINFGPLANTRANFVIRTRNTTTGVHVEVFDPLKGVLRQ